MRTANFSPRVRLIIAQRAGFRCSYPGCDLSTVGAGHLATDVESIGEAAHIYSASDVGPRGTGDLSQDVRSSAENGIWMCRTHARLIDTNYGQNYPASLLQAWKAIHEYRIASEVKGNALPAEWLNQIQVFESPLFKSNQKFSLGKVTLIEGDNGSGKTAICDWIASAAGHIEHLDRWRRISRVHNSSIDLCVDYLSKERRECRMIYDGGKSLKMEVNRVRTISSAVSCPIMYLNGDDRYRSGLNDIEYFSSLWNVHPMISVQVFNEFGRGKFDFIPRVKCSDTSMLVERGSGFYSLAQASRDVRTAIAVGGAIVLADEYAQNSHSVLVLDLGYFYPRAAAELLSRLSSSDFRFQTVYTDIPTRFRSCETSGWTKVRLTGAVPNIQIEQ